MDSLDTCHPRNSINERYKFLSSVWSETFVGDQLHSSYPSTEVRNTLRCENLSVKVPLKKKAFDLKHAIKVFKASNHDRLDVPVPNEKVLLDKVCAEIQGGEILAVLGPSGAGKTLFLSALIGHPSVKGGKISGNVYLNGCPLIDPIVEESVAFVPQKDLSVDSLTINEHLQFVASLRLWREPKHTRSARINELLSQMNLKKCRSCELRSLSNGERRRVAIASQMIARPAALLLDEPLTGLDAAVADNIMAALAQIAQPTSSSPQGCAVVSVFHQPRPQTLRFVSKVMLIADGRVAFYGTPEETEKFYYRLNPTIETKYGAWNALLESFMVSLHKPETVDYIVDTFQGDICYQNNHLDSAKVKFYAPKPHTRMRAPWSTQMKWLLWRETMDAKHLKMFDSATVMFMVTAVIIGLWYARSNERNGAGIQTASGLLFMVSSEIIYSNAYSVLQSFTPQVPVILREKRLYGPSAYYLSKVLSLFPRSILHTILFTSIVHLSGNLGGDGGIQVFLPICGILLIVCLAAISFGCMLAGISNGVERAYTIAQPLDLLANSMGGIFGGISHNTFHVTWLRYFSTFFYSFECISILYWGSVKQFDCVDETSHCPTSTSILAGTGFSAENLPRDIIALFLYTIVCHSIGFFGMWIRFKNYAVY